MSTIDTTADAAGMTGRRSPRPALLHWIAAGVALVAVVAAVTVAVWPASETDKARADGNQAGQAVAELYDAQSADDVDAALADLQSAAADTRDHAGDAVADQVAAQGDALSRALDGFVGVHSSADAFDVDLYQAELDAATDDLTRQTDAFRAQGTDVQQAFWDGFNDSAWGD